MLTITFLNFIILKVLGDELDSCYEHRRLVSLVSFKLILTIILQLQL